MIQTFHGLRRSFLLLLPLLALALPTAATRAPRFQEADPSKDAMRMGSPASLPQGDTVEDMWPAPTAEDWKKPCLVSWQRSFADAVRIAEQSGRPILVCVNMDGEPASEHFAGIRYRQEDTARLLEPYVCLTASVYRHTPRDYDEQGRRVVCPRLGTVTCGEHIAIETELYAKYFEGQRVAPRHIMLEPDGSKSYDVYYSWDTASVYTAFRTGVEGRPEPKLLGDLPLAERVTSSDVADRIALENTYLRGTREARRSILESTFRSREVDQVDLLRLALFGLDVDLARLARKALARCDSEAAVDLIAEALKFPMDEPERVELIAAANRLAEKFPRARTLVAVQEGLAAPSRYVDPGSWSRELEAEYQASAEASLARRLDSRAETVAEHPEDGSARLDFAEALLARAQETSDSRYSALLHEDAHNAALEAEKLGARGWRLDAVLAVTASTRGDRNTAVARALAAIEGGMPRPGAGAEGVQERTAVQVLALFAQARQQAIAAAYQARKPWDPEWLADIHAAYAVLVRHPLGSDQNIADGYDFLQWLGATQRASAQLEQGLARFPESWLLHERLRAKVLWDRGAEELEATYARMLAKEDAAPGLEWLAGFASLVAAESHRRAGAPEKALGAYERGIGHYQRDLALHPDHESSVDHYVALARAGRAAIALEHGDLALATSEILAAFELCPAASAAFDGLGITPIDTGRMLLARLDKEAKDELADTLQAGFDRLDPRLLELPDNLRGVPNEGARAESRRRRPRGEGN